MSLLKDYIDKNISVPALETELLSLITKYNQHRGTYLFVFSTAVEKQLPLLGLNQSDFYTIYDLLRERECGDNLDLYLETPGGSGESAEEIVRFLRKKFKKVNFIIAGEAKSAGTIMAMSANEIFMTDSASLGPIDAQMRIGRSVVSAHDYMEWVNDKRKEAAKNKLLNPVDAVMVAQVSPGELLQVDNALRFAHDLVEDWLPKYKFAGWDKTETKGKPVTAQMRKKRAKEIAEELTNHSKWRTHGRSLKIPELQTIGLRINRIDEDPTLAEIVYRIHTVSRLLFEFSSIFKIFATAEEKIFRLAQRAMPGGVNPVPLNMKEVDGVQLDVKCDKCGKVHKIFAQFVKSEEAARSLIQAGHQKFPKDAIIKCTCGFQIDLAGIRNEMEAQSGKKILVDDD